MKPIAIFRHSAADGPAYLADFLREAHHPFIEIRVDEGEKIPSHASPFSGIALMGGPMSVNDDLPWIKHSLALIQDAYTQHIPLLGHCLGGQLMSKALGGTVSRNPAGKEIGWHEIEIVDPALGQHWLGNSDRFYAFHWHGETFTLPTGAQWLARSEHCTNQAFVMGPHIGMQFHIEMDATKAQEWAQDEDPKWAHARTQYESIQDSAAILAGIEKHLFCHQTTANHIYSTWLKNVQV